MTVWSLPFWLGWKSKYKTVSFRFKFLPSGQYGWYFVSVALLDQRDLLNIKEFLFAELTGEVFLAPMCLAASLFITLTTFLGVLTCRDLPLDEFLGLVLLFPYSITFLKILLSWHKAGCLALGNLRPKSRIRPGITFSSVTLSFVTLKSKELLLSCVENWGLAII